MASAFSAMCSPQFGSQIFMHVCRYQLALKPRGTTPIPMHILLCNRKRCPNIFLERMYKLNVSGLQNIAIFHTS